MKWNKKAEELIENRRKKDWVGSNGNKENDEGNRIEQEKGLSICFWNVAGFDKEYKELERYLEKFDILSLTETLIDKEG